MNHESKLQEYARLLIRVGLALRKEQRLIISTPVECAYFARMCAREAYETGCKEVVMNWSDDAMTRMKYLHAAEEVFDTVPAWREQFYNGYAREGAAYLVISASDPENLRGVDPNRLVKSQRASGKALAEFNRLQMSSAFPWCIAAMPIPSWAEKVFPDLSSEQAVDALWDAIFYTIRVQGDGHAVDRWRTHLDTLQRRTETLNAFRFRSLRYSNALGTNFTIELPEHHIWESGEDRTPDGQRFIANIPTEEIFTAPLRNSANGIIYAALPLVHDGNIIDKFHFVVRDGKIIEAHAERGEAELHAAISVDEGASYFGEVALVPYDSPISNQKLLYYDTLFDENAACHLAFGEAYPCIEGGRDMSKEELTRHGLNDSITHVDFMVGTPDLNITGVTADGREIPVFTDGNFSAALS